MPTLLVAPSDSLRAYVDKGELKPRYFNARDTFTDVHVLEPSEDAECPREARVLFGAANVTVHPCGPVDWWSLRRGPLSRWRTARAVTAAEEARPDVIRAYDPLAAGWLARAAALRAGVPYIVSVHTSFDRDVRRGLLRRRRWRGLALHLFTRRWVERPVLRGAARVIAIHRFVARYVAAMGRRDSVLIYNRADTDRFSPPLARPARPRAHVLTVGSAIPERGLDLALAAMARTDCELVIVGRGPEKGRLESLARENGLGDRVRFVDRVPNEDMPGVYRDADIYLSTVAIGGVVIPVLEAAASGLPIVAARPFKGEDPEIADEVGIVSERDPDAIAAAIRHLAGDLGERERMGTRARAWSERRSDPEADEAALYRDLLHRERR